MWLVWTGVALLVLKLLRVEPVAGISWWWLVLPFLLAFLWFDLVEERLGLNKKRAFDEIEKAKKERIRKALERDKNFRVRR
jgi:small Trp-rich protein